MTNQLDEVVDAIKAFDLQALSREYKTLIGIRDWALRNLGLDYQQGDRVVITDPAPSMRGGGWDAYREALSPGQTGIAGEVTFDETRGTWYVLVGMDRSWSVHERGGFERACVRYWKGPAAETPEGFEAPGTYDQERYPDGRTKHFYMHVDWVVRAASDKPGPQVLWQRKHP